MPVRKKRFVFLSAESFACLPAGVKFSHVGYFTLLFVDPALLVPGVVPLDEPLGALQLGV